METPRLVIDKDIAREGTSLSALFGLPEDVISAKTVANFLDAHSDAISIEVEVATDGGSTSEAKQMFDRLVNSGKEVTTIGYKVNSSGVVVFLAGSKRLISRNADFIIHPVWIDPSGLPMKLEADDMIRFGEEMKDEENRLLNIYCSVIGEDKREEVTKLMKNDTNISADDAVRLGFATGILEDEKAVSKSNKSFSFSNGMTEIIMNKLPNRKSNQNSEDMKGLKETLENINKTLNKFINKDDNTETQNTETENTEEQNQDTLNASVELAEGGSLYYDGELAEGVALFTDESMETPAPDGDHALADGRVVSVSGGMVSSIAAASTEGENKDDDNTQNTEVEDLKNEVSSLKTTVSEQTEALNNIAETLSNMAPAFTALQNLVPGEKGGETTKRNRRTGGKTVHDELTNLEKKRLNQGKR